MTRPMMSGIIELDLTAGATLAAAAAAAEAAEGTAGAEGMAGRGGAAIIRVKSPGPAFTVGSGGVDGAVGIEGMALCN